MGVVAAVKGMVRRTLIARSNGIDLSRLDKVPDSLSLPLHRDQMAPSARLSGRTDPWPPSPSASPQYSYLSPQSSVLRPQSRLWHRSRTAESAIWAIYFG